MEPQHGQSVCSVLVMPSDHLPAHKLAADWSSETHSIQANSYRLWLRLERDILGSVRGKWTAALCSHLVTKWRLNISIMMYKNDHSFLEFFTSSYALMCNLIIFMLPNPRTREEWPRPTQTQQAVFVLFPNHPRPNRVNVSLSTEPVAPSEPCQSLN